MCRTLKKYMPFFGKFATGISRHIKHEYFAEMSQKSEVVSLVYLIKVIVLYVYYTGPPWSCFKIRAKL